jgi:hypothetical protein
LVLNKGRNIMPQSGAAATTFSKWHTWQAEAQNGKTNKN